MNDRLAQSLIDELRHLNWKMTALTDAVSERHPYKPLIISIPGNVRAEDFEKLKAYLDVYFEELEKKPDV